MELLLEREIFSAMSTAGQLYIEGAQAAECFTLELPDHQGLIPEGRYEVKPYQSPRFNCRVPMLVDVPGRALIEMHPGNTARDTRGCILVGLARAPDRILRSQAAFQALLPKLDGAWKAKEPVWLTVRAKPMTEAAA